MSEIARGEIAEAEAQRRARIDSDAARGLRIAERALGCIGQIVASAGIDDASANRQLDPAPWSASSSVSIGCVARKTTMHTLCDFNGTQKPVETAREIRRVLR